MFSEQLKRIIRLVTKTGDKVIIADSQGQESPLVAMSLTSYEKMLTAEEQEKEVGSVSLAAEPEPLTDSQEEMGQADGLTEEDLTDKINREISVWKNNDNTESSVADDRPIPAWNIPPQVKNKAQEVN
ncbi:MAG: hypothetical protein ACOX0C_01920 [Patescibacteria group bacterium]|jgi:hypothetical protein